MREHILVLSRDRVLLANIKDMMRRFGVDKIDLGHDLTTDIPFGRLAATYNVLVVDKAFAGNARDTAIVVHKIRKEFFGPMIGFETYAGDGELFSLQVAGCNFCLSLPTHLVSVSSEHLCLLIGKISEELNEPHQAGLST